MQIQLTSPPSHEWFAECGEAYASAYRYILHATSRDMVSFSFEDSGFVEQDPYIYLKHGRLPTDPEACSSSSVPRLGLQGI